MLTAMAITAAEAVRDAHEWCEHALASWALILGALDRPAVAGGVDQTSTSSSATSTAVPSSMPSARRTSFFTGRT